MRIDTQMVAGVREGDLLAGKYRIDKILGAGAMGIVVAAHHIHLDDKVAIKFLAPETLANRDAVARFVREARAAVKIKSEHVARVSDVGTLETGAPYMVMEFLEGCDLASWLEQRGPLPVEQAVEFILQACEALAEAHALGIVHRDVKPANLFVVRRADGVESVKVLDFGISKITGFSASHPDSSMTRTSTILGSPLYMSPEQMQSSKDVDARGDIWALGVVLHELLIGESPFVGESMPELIAKILSTHPASLRARRPEVPDALELVIFKCLEKDRNNRYQNVGHLAVALLPFASKRGRGSVDRISGVMRSSGLSGTDFAPVSTVEPGKAEASTLAPFGRTASGPSRGTLAVLLGIAGVVGVVVVVALVIVFTRNRSPATPVAASAAEPPAASEAIQAKTDTIKRADSVEAVGSPSVAPIASAPAPSTTPSAPARSAARRDVPRAAQRPPRTGGSTAPSAQKPPPAVVPPTARPGTVFDDRK